ncbi:hypothetical protein [Dysgonomonas reticulitermitis]
MLRIYVFLLIFILLVSGRVMAQKRSGFELEAGLYAPTGDDESFPYYISGKYCYWFNSYLAYTIGGGGVYSRFDGSFDSPKNRNTVYYIENDKMISLYCMVGLKAVTPSYKHIGLIANLNFQFEPIPFNTVAIDKKTFSLGNTMPESKYISKFVFTRFNPCYNLQLGLFYDLKSENRITRFS